MKFRVNKGGLVRMNNLITEKQGRALKTIAVKLNTNVSELIRRSIDYFLLTGEYRELSRYYDILNEDELKDSNP